jgi:alkylation response protein AidB-like acyl-CoA dehydrogenase
MAELAIVLEALGAEIAPGALLPTVVASSLVAEVGTDRQREDLLPGLADGTVTASLALTGDVERRADGALRGEAGPALGAAWARVHLVRSGADIVILRNDAVRITLVSGLDASLGMGRLDVDGAPAAEVLPGAASAAVRLLRTLAAAEAAGGARSTLDAALGYAKVREQFGRMIGSFQAIKHHLANMLIRSELAVAAAWDAARLAPGDQADLAAAVAAAIALDAYQRNARMNIQLHGGIGFTWEHDGHLFLRRATALAGLAGTAERAAEDVIALVRRGVRRQYGVVLPPEAEGYRKAAREFAARYRTAPEGDRRRLLVESGYLVPHWRKPWGREAGPVEQLVIEEEFADLDVPNLQISGWVLLTLSQTATPEQIERWIKPGLLGEQVWCQLFSEPEAGSDAAAVRTRGVKVDGGWRVSGQKVWTSNAQNCQRGLATIRTGPDKPKHKGITMMAIDLSAPGVTVRPLREITGDAVFNEVFFDDVFVADEDVVGDPGEGWAVARATLANERVTIGGSRREGLQATDLVALHEKYAAGDAGRHRDMGEVIAEEMAMEMINLRAVERAVAGAAPTAEGNITKILSAEHAQRVSELAMAIGGPALVAGAEPEIAFEYLFHRALTIAGGTSEVSRNVIAERILGLPREVIPN